MSDNVIYVIVGGRGGSGSPTISKMKWYNKELTKEMLTFRFYKFREAAAQQDGSIWDYRKPTVYKWEMGEVRKVMGSKMIRDEFGIDVSKWRVRWAKNGN